MTETQPLPTPAAPVPGEPQSQVPANDGHEPTPVEPGRRRPSRQLWTVLAVGVVAVLVGALVGFGLGRATGGSGGGPGGFGPGGFPGGTRGQQGQQFGGPQGQPGQQFGQQPGGGSGQ